ncbi:hypothetical protein DXD59_08915 [Olsenella sp. TM06-36]|nr:MULTISPECIES: hypothetical protein [unclassified Olsenella]RGJ45407.1 hypothetical protein DXD59_08915 [Olsenella sp. TM06-36]RHJ94596.1 hypothetical protein DW092_03370 [Olsenella sp. AM05-7]RHJ98711.1 hypothetical protein DW090_04580 [Olsenella sp. AM05-17]
MTKPYFGDTTTIATTIMILGLVVFIGYTIVNRGSVQHWGMRGLLLLAFGLVVCCFAAARDGLDKTIQSSIDGSCAAGLFPLVSIPTVVGCIGALVIIASAIAMLIANSQQAKELCFWFMASGVAVKIMVVEIARVIAL